MSTLTGAGALIRFILRRDRVRLPVWVLAITLAVLASVASFKDTYPTATDRQTRAEVLNNPVGKLFTGPGYGLDNYTFGAMTANEMLLYTAIAIGLMSIFLVVRHTRAEEETGRAELIRATVVGRHASLVATLVVVGGANVMIGVLLTLGLPASLAELSTSGSLAFAASVVGVGLVFSGVAALVAQLSANGRSALGLASLVLGAAFAVRSVGDLGNGALAWLSPFGWATRTRAYVDERWWPLLLLAATAALLVVAAIRINARRDLGASLIAERPGRVTASGRLAGPLGLAVRLQRATLVGWTIPLFLLGLVYGAIAKEASQLYEDVSTLDDYLARIGAADAAEQYLALTLFITALIAAGYAIQSTLRLHAEESSQRAETVLATAVSRWRFVASHVTLAVGGSVVLLAAYGLGAGLTRAISAGDAADLPRLVGAAVAYAPALWVFVGAATALFGLAPRAVSAAWAAFAGLAFVGFLGPVLQLPDWVYELSPVEHVPRMPVAGFDVVPLAVLTLVSAGLLAAGLLGFRRRDLVAG